MPHYTIVWVRVCISELRLILELIFSQLSRELNFLGFGDQSAYIQPRGRWSGDSSCTAHQAQINVCCVLRGDKAPPMFPTI